MTEAKQALNDSITELEREKHTKQVENGYFYRYVLLQGRTYQENHEYTPAERLANGMAPLTRFLDPATEDKEATKSRFLTAQMGKITDALNKVKADDPKLSSDEQKKVVTDLIESLTKTQENVLVKHHSDNVEKYGLIGLASTAAFFMALRLGVPQAFLRAARVIS